MPGSMRCRRSGIAIRRREERMRWKRKASTPGAAKTRPDSLRHRWRALPRLLRLLWELGPREVLLMAGFDFVNGLLPIVRVAVLLRLIDSALAAAEGKTPWTRA